MSALSSQLNGSKTGLVQSSKFKVQSSKFKVQSKKAEEEEEEDLILVEDGSAGFEEDSGDVDVSSFGRQVERRRIAGPIAARRHHLKIEFHQLLQDGHRPLFRCYVGARVAVLLRCCQINQFKNEKFDE